VGLGRAVRDLEVRLRAACEVADSSPSSGDELNFRSDLLLTARSSRKCNEFMYFERVVCEVCRERMEEDVGVGWGGGVRGGKIRYRPGGDRDRQKPLADKPKHCRWSLFMARHANYAPEIKLHYGLHTRQ
jgi:hypothetical protein